MLVRREVILVEIESTYGVDPGPTGANAVLVENPAWSNESARMNDREGVNTSLTTLQKVFGGTLMTLTFDVEIKGSGAAGTAPEFGPLLRSCALLETVVPTTMVTYGPVSTGIESCTIYYYQDGTLYRLTGCRGNVEFDFTAGALGKMSFTMTGHINASDPTDAALVTPTYDSTVPPPAIGATVTIGGTAVTVAQVMLGLNNTVAKPPDLSAADGFADVQITRRDVAGSFNPESELVATEPFYSDYKAGTTLALVCSSIGSAAGNIVALTAPALYYREIAPGDREGIRIYDISFGAAESSGDDEFLLTFT